MRELWLRKVWLDKLIQEAINEYVKEVKVLTEKHELHDYLKEPDNVRDNN